MAPSTQFLPGRMPLEGQEPFPTRAGEGETWGRASPSGCGLSGEQLHSGRLQCPGDRLQTTAFLSPHGNRACTLVSRETQSLASRLPQQRLWLSWLLGRQPRGGSWTPRPTNRRSQVLHRCGAGCTGAGPSLARAPGGHSPGSQAPALSRVLCSHPR